MTKSIETDALIRLYAEPGHGYTDLELAEHFEVGREAIFKRRQKLKDDGYEFNETERGRYRLDSETFVSHIKVNWEEALILYLATRRLSRSTRLPSRPVQNALGKLATALYKPMTERLVKAAANVPKHPAEAQRSSVLTELIRGWSEHLKVHIRYRPLQSDQMTRHTICPYLIEPSPWSDSVYVIATSNVMDGYVPFQLERIENATLSTEPFTIDPKFEEETLFKYTWGIWSGSGKPEPVRLKFTGPAAIRRLNESVWHPNQTISQPDENGHVIWAAPIAEWREMLPWVRGWGAECEVLGPEGLREEIKGHLWKMTQTYNLPTQTTDPEARLLRLWGKTTDDPDRFHPALYHLFDVAHIAQQLLGQRASGRWRNVLASVLNTEPETLHEWVPYLIALHDLGKISVPFQVLNTQQHSRLKREGFEFGIAIQKDGRELHHTIVGRMVLKDEVAGWPDNLKAAFIEMVSGHHGVFQQTKQEHHRDFNRLQEADEWPQLRQCAIRILQSYLLQQWPTSMPNPANQSAAMMALNGFCILCDWLGSDEDYFAPTPASFTSLLEYLPLSRQRAYNRVRDAGFFQLARSNAPTHFAALFPDIVRVRPLQQAIDAIPADLLAHPTLTIIEAPTGEGKTEAALTLARRISALRGSDEMYIALPTTATSNAMYNRVQTHLEQRLGLSKELVRLVHGQDFLKKDDLPVNPMESIEPEESPEPPSLSWFGPKKKALLAPFGVGTVDQAELSALNVRHNALRMIGLAGKTIILDEVHAYDTYMTTIIKRMLTWLSALGSSVILLSATLPSTRRKELAQAFAGNQANAIADFEAYPSLLTVGPAGHHFDSPPACNPNKTLVLQLIPFADDNPLAKAQWLLDQIKQGGCVCWMTNTVKRAQQIFDILLQLAPPEVTLDLLHARLPLTDRENREKEIFEKYGPTGHRPTKAIVVGTQVLEQSLDLDFDVMLTDLAPIDLILQRAGRLHRHERDKTSRHSHQEPHLYVNPIIEVADTKIYDAYILQKTLHILTDRPILTLPADYRPLIETVYDDTEPAPNDPLFDAWQRLKDKQDTLKSEARQRLMNDPKLDYPFYVGAKIKGLEDDEDSSSWLAAPTRWGQESLTVIPLLREGNAAHILTSESVIPLDQKASRDTQLELLRQSLRLSHPKLVQHFKHNPPAEKLFTTSPLLRRCYPLWLEPDTEGFTASDTPLTVKLHPQLGLVIGEL